MRRELIEKSKDLLSGHCDAELAESLRAWLNLVEGKSDAEIDAAKEKLARAAVIAKIENAVCTVDECLAFLDTPDAAAKLGKERAESFLAHMKELKARKEKFCDCPACVKALALYQMIK